MTEPSVEIVAVVDEGLGHSSHVVALGDGHFKMDELEKAMIVKSMEHHGGNVSKVAEALGLSRAALYRRFEKYEIPV